MYNANNYLITISRCHKVSLQHMGSLCVDCHSSTNVCYLSPEHHSKRLLYPQINDCHYKTNHLRRNCFEPDIWPQQFDTHFKH